VRDAQGDVLRHRRVVLRPVHSDAPSLENASFPNAHVLRPGQFQSI
jgi:hypothetical protein